MIEKVFKLGKNAKYCRLVTLMFLILFIVSLTFEASGATRYYEYDTMGRLVKTISPNTVFRYSFDAANNLTSESVAAILGGDVDVNMTVNLTDVVLGLQILAGVPSSAAIYPGADADGDGKLGMKEVVYALNKVAEQ